MIRAAPPPLPAFLAPHLPFSRGAGRLEARGPDSGRLLHFLDHGEPAAPPVLLQHGNPTWSFLWRRVVAGLRGRRCVAPDLLGLGFSDRLPRSADHTVERHVAALAELVEALDLRDVVLVGQDWGGPLLAGVGERLPHRVAGLVLANTSVLVPRRPRGTAFHRFARLPLLADLVFRGLGFPQNVLAWTQGDRRSMAGVVGRAYRWPLRRWRDRAAPLGLARMVPTSAAHRSVEPLRRAEAWVRDFRGPVALVWGTRDPLLGRALPRHRAALPRARVTTTAAGHFLQEETPQALVEAIEWAAAGGTTG